MQNHFIKGRFFPFTKKSAASLFIAMTIVFSIHTEEKPKYLDPTLAVKKIFWSDSN